MEKLDTNKISIRALGGGGGGGNKTIILPFPRDECMNQGKTTTT